MIDRIATGMIAMTALHETEMTDLEIGGAKSLDIMIVIVLVNGWITMIGEMIEVEAREHGVVARVQLVSVV